MGMLVDVRKYPSETSPDELVEASKIIKKWFRTTDNFEDYLSAKATQVPNDLNAHVVADLFVYIQDELNYQEALRPYSAAISENRNAFVVLLAKEDRDWLLDQLTGPALCGRFAAFAAALNDEYYDYSNAEIEETVAGFLALLRLIDEHTGLIVSVR